MQVQQTSSDVGHCSGIVEGRGISNYTIQTVLKSHDNVKQKSWIRWSMSFKFRKCNGLPVVSPELAQIVQSSCHVLYDPVKILSGIKRPIVEL